MDLKRYHKVQELILDMEKFRGEYENSYVFEILEAKIEDVEFEEEEADTERAAENAALLDAAADLTDEIVDMIEEGISMEFPRDAFEKAVDRKLEEAIENLRRVR